MEFFRGLDPSIVVAIITPVLAGIGFLIKYHFFGESGKIKNAHADNNTSMFSTNSRDMESYLTHDCSIKVSFMKTTESDRKEGWILPGDESIFIKFLYQGKKTDFLEGVSIVERQGKNYFFHFFVNTKGKPKFAFLGNNIDDARKKFSKDGDGYLQQDSHDATKENLKQILTH